MTPQESPPQRPTRLPEPVRAFFARRWVPDAVGLFLVMLVVVAGYFEVPFEGKTFNASSRVVGVQGCGTPTGECLPHLPQDPRVDPYASSWALDPWGQVTHRALADGEVPLWNPSQGIGMPLAGNMQSSVFDPILLMFHIHPTLLVQDVSFLVALILTGLGAYAAARMLRLSPVAATVAGSVYALSGWFFTYGNNHWFITYLWLPIVVACIEWILRSTRRVPVALVAVAMACTAFAGMPEAMFMSYVAAGAYSFFRLLIGPRAQPRLQSALRLGGGAVAGVALAAPLLLLFVQYLPLSFNAHDNLGSLPPLTDPLRVILNWLMPRISPIASNDQAYTRNWVGCGAVLLATVAVTSRRARRKFVLWPMLLVGAGVALQIYGGSLVSWTRHIPLWSQALWPNFGTPIIALMLALLAAAGVQTVMDRIVSVKGLAAGLGVLLVIVVALIATSEVDLALAHNVFLSGGWPLAIVVAAAIIGVIVLLPGRRSGLLIAGIVVLEMVVLAPRGFYAPRESPYPTRSWINYVAEQTAVDGSRVFSVDGTLFPDTAGVYGLNDPRMVDALYPDRWWLYLRSFISKGLLDRFYGTGASETAPNIAANPMFDILGIRYLLYNTSTSGGPPVWSGDQYKKVFRGDGVAIYENTHAGPRAFVVHDVHAVPDKESALVYLAGGEPTYFPDGSVQLTQKDPRETAVIEADPSDVPKRKTCNEPITSDARVVSYSPSTVRISVDTSCDGLLVLGDEYYPGWSATVNGEGARIFATDIALRGVPVSAGHSIVEFHYAPAAFKTGVVIAVLGGAGLLVFLFVPTLVAFRRRKRRPAPELVQ